MDSILTAEQNDYYQKSKYSLDSEYKLISCLGEGGNAICFLLKKDNQYYTLKMPLFNDDASRKKIEDEAELLQNCTSPLVPKLVEFDNEQFTPSILMDYIPGISLSAAIYNKLLNNKELLKVFTLIILVLDDLHSKNYIHRDITPNNIMIDKDLNPHVIDWGERTILSNGSTLKTNNYHGTIPYNPPEAFELEYSIKSDIFMLGGTLLFAMTERFPFQGMYYSADEVINFYKIKSQEYETEVPISKFDEISRLINQPDQDLSQLSETVGPVLSLYIKSGHNDEFYKKGSEPYNDIKDDFRRKMVDIAYKCMEPNQEDRPTTQELSEMFSNMVEEDPSLFNGGVDGYSEFLEGYYGIEKDFYGTEENVMETISKPEFAEVEESHLKTISMAMQMENE